MKRLNLTIDEEVYFEIVRSGLIDRQELSKTINAFLKIYLDTSKQYDKTISELDKQIQAIRLKHLNETAKKTKDTIKAQETQKELKEQQDNEMEALRRNNPLRHI